MQLPLPRGPLSRAVIEALASTPTGAPVVADPDAAVRDLADPLADDDLQLTLWVLYELHYRGFDEVDPAREWDPELIRVRGACERVFEQSLRDLTAQTVARGAAVEEGDDNLAERLFTLTGSFDGPALAGYLHRSATAEQLTEFLVQRSIYQLKESDPSSFVIPRLDGVPKAALVELQYDEYGDGHAERIHATLYGDALEACGLDRSYGAYLDRVPAITLAVNNAMSLFGLHRRLRGAALGHLGAFEATSSLPSRRIAAGIRRLGLAEEAAAYFDEHVEADAVHEQLALRLICGGLVEQDPALEPDVLLGAATCLHLDALAADQLLTAWQAGRSSLRELPGERPTAANRPVAS
jgi:hypothetical protein